MIINLNNEDQPGSHWVALKKNKQCAKYYDSFGNLRPPIEVMNYLKGCVILYNYNRDQKMNTEICGHLCLKFLCQ